MDWVHAEICANRIESVTLCKHPQTGGTAVLVKWCGPGLISKWVYGETFEDCISNLKRIELPKDSWAARMDMNVRTFSFEHYMKSLGLSDDY